MPVLRSAFRTVLRVSTLALLLPLSLPAQNAPARRDLPAPNAEIEDPYTIVISVRELTNGRVAVVDGADAEVSVADFASRGREALGRQGSGPGEYRTPTALFRGAGDTLWLLDPAQQRMAVFLPDLTPGVPFSLQMFNTQTMTALSQPYFVDAAGVMYASGLKIGGAGGPNMTIPDSVTVLKFNPRAPESATTLAMVRFPTSGTPQMRVEGQVIHYSMAFPGLVAADSWVVFSDGRVAIVRGANYQVEFIQPDGRRSAPKIVPFDRIPVTAQDREAEMAQARKDADEQIAVARRQMPPGMTLNFTMTEPETWPTTYPALAPLQAFAAPDGRLWLQRAVPSRLERQHWDVLDASGNVVARWQLAKGQRLVGVGRGVAYTVRKDEDDLLYLQRIAVDR